MRRYLILLAALSLAPPLPAVPIPPDAAPKIAAAIDRSYYNPAALNPKAAPADTAALPLGVRMEMLPPSAAPIPIRSETLPGTPVPFGYLRLRTLLPAKQKEKEWAALETDLAAWNRSAGGLVLDLRGCTAASGNPAEFAAAARIASWFISPGHVLFTLQSQRPDTPQQVFQSTPSPSAPGAVPFSLPLVVLLNPETGGAGATLAAVLRRETGAILVGRTADDSAALFQNLPLDITPPALLRVPSAVVQLPDGSLLLGNPVSPDISLYIDPKDEQEILAQTALGPAARGLVEAPPRHHMNEASLVHEENPEIADYLAPPPKDEALPLQDTALLRALDILKGIHLFPIAAQQVTN